MSAYSTAVLALSPLYYFRCNETSGVTLANSGNGTSTVAQLAGTPVLNGASLILNDAGTNYAADGVDDRFSLQSPEMILDDQGTVMFVGKRTVADNLVIARTRGSSNVIYLLIEISVTGVTVRYNVGAGEFSVKHSMTINVGDINHYTIVQDPTDGFLIYVNGGLRSTTITGTAADVWYGTLNNLGDLFVGYKYQNSAYTYYEGEYDEYAYWSTRLTAQQIFDVAKLNTLPYFPGKGTINLTGHSLFLPNPINLIFAKATINLNGKLLLTEYSDISFIRDVFINSAMVSNQFLPTSILTDVIEVHDKLFITYFDLITDTLSYLDTPIFSVELLEKLIDSFILDENISDSATLLSVLSDTLSVLDVVSYATVNTITDTIVIGDLLAQKAVFYNKLLDTLLYSGTLFNQGSITLIVKETVILSDNTSNYAIFKSILNDTIELFGEVNFDGETFLTYTVNTQTSGVTEYTNYKFNSFSYPYACASDGLYKLDDGDNDEGENIKSGIKTGLMDFSSSVHKQIPYAYLGITSDGEILLKVTNMNRGVKKERWYGVSSINEDCDTTRIQLGRGVKARYWQFEVLNNNGSDLKLESIELLPLMLRRRI